MKQTTENDFLFEHEKQNKYIISCTRRRDIPAAAAVRLTISISCGAYSFKCVLHRGDRRVQSQLFNILLYTETTGAHTFSARVSKVLTTHNNININNDNNNTKK